MSEPAILGERETRMDLSTWTTNPAYRYDNQNRVPAVERAVGTGFPVLVGLLNRHRVQFNDWNSNTAPGIQLAVWIELIF